MQDNQPIIVIWRIVTFNDRNSAYLIVLHR
jgi:hypothetical protein